MNRDENRFFSPGYMIDALRYLPVDDWKNNQVLSRSAYRAIESHVYRGYDLYLLNMARPHGLQFPTEQEQQDFLPRCHHPFSQPATDTRRYRKSARSFACRWERRICTCYTPRLDESCDSYVSRVCRFGYNYPSFQVALEIGSKLTRHHLTNFMQNATRLTFDDTGAKIQCGETILTVRANWGHEAWS